mgnify:CR=1 FL=1
MDHVHHEVTEPEINKILMQPCNIFRGNRRVHIV